MTSLIGPTAPPAPQRPAYAHARINVESTTRQNNHKCAIPPHSLVFGDLDDYTLATAKRPEDRLQPVSACGTMFDPYLKPFGIVEDSMLDLEAIRKHPGHRHVGVCVQGLVTMACANSDLANAKIGNFLEIKNKATHTFKGAPADFKGLEIEVTQNFNPRKTFGKIYGFSTTRANEVEVLLV